MKIFIVVFFVVLFGDGKMGGIMLYIVNIVQGF